MNSQNLPSASATGGQHRRLDPDMTKHMGHSTKLKLAKLAKKFFSRKGLSGRKAGHGLPHLSSDSRAQGSSLASAGQAPLLDDDELNSNHGHGSMPNEYTPGGPGNYGRL